MSNVQSFEESYYRQRQQSWQNIETMHNLSKF